MRPQRKIPKKHHYVDVKTLHHKSVTYHARMTAIARFPAQNIRLR